MSLIYKGQQIFGPRGPSGPDGNPIGTVISYMGVTAPKDYLICDGAEYPVAGYPDLAKFFSQQFNSANHFGGDGTTTFAVPDLRNLFLRGYHGEAEEHLSGAVGERQEATNYPMILGSKSAIRYPSGTENVDILLAEIRPDSVIGDRRQATSSNPTSTSIVINDYYTGRPVNMAILYCIKAVESVPTENVYSTEEIRIGTWIDGKPLYRKSLALRDTSLQNHNNTAITENVDEFVNMYGTLRSSNGNTYGFPAIVKVDDRVLATVTSDGILKFFAIGTWNNYTALITFEYTKTTD